MSDAWQAAYDFLKRHEGYSPTAKWDYRQYSGGYGSRAEPGETFTPEKAEERLRADAAPVVSWVEKNVSVPLTDGQRTALVSFGYNFGTDDLDRLKDDINSGDWNRVGARMLSFNKAGGEVLDGLVKRRQEEAALLTGGQLPAATDPATALTAVAQPASGDTGLLSGVFKEAGIDPNAQGGILGSALNSAGIDTGGYLSGVGGDLKTANAAANAAGGLGDEAIQAPQSPIRKVNTQQLAKIMQRRSTPLGTRAQS